MNVQSRGGETGRAVNPSAYAAMYENELRSKNLNTGGLSASQSQGFHLEAELMLVGGGAGDSDGSILEGRDLAQVALDTQTVAVVECPEDATLTEFLGLTRQRCVLYCNVVRNAIFFSCFQPGRSLHIRIFYGAVLSVVVVRFWISTSKKRGGAIAPFE